MDFHSEAGSPMQCPGTPRKPRVSLDEGAWLTPSLRAKELPVVSNVSTACPSSGCFLDFETPQLVERSQKRSCQRESIEKTFELTAMPQSFEAFAAFFDDENKPGAGSGSEALSALMTHGPEATLRNEAHGSTAAESPPATPLQGCGQAQLTVPTVPHPSTLPSLLSVLQRNDLQGMMHVLALEPDAAALPFDQDIEPPICAAVRLRCSADMVAHLLKSGADPEAEDMWGRTAMHHLELQKTLQGMCAERLAAVEALLLDHGCAAATGPRPESKASQSSDLWMQWPAALDATPWTTDMQGDTIDWLGKLALWTTDMQGDTIDWLGKFGSADAAQADAAKAEQLSWDFAHMAEVPRVVESI